MTARPRFGGWLLAPEGPAGGEVQLGPDGRRSFILRGTRWVDHPDGSIERAREVFHEEDVKAMELPPRLGGGYLFYVTSGSGTLMWRADSWTGDLRPLGRVEPPVSSLISGFDRLYLASATSYTLRALDPWNGKALDLAPLPPAAAYGDMVFADAWRAVVLAGGRGALATFDAGETWYPLAAPDAIAELQLGPSGSILAATEEGQFELDVTGRLVPTSARGSDALFRDADRFMRYPREAFPAAPVPAAQPVPPLGRRPLRAAVLRGFPDTPSTAVVIERGRFGRVRLEDGAVLSSEPFSGRTPCRGLALGLGFGFVCGDGHGPTDVYAYRHGELELDLTLDGPRSVRSSGNGALVVGAPCSLVRRARDRGDRAARTATAGADERRVAHYCVRQVSGELFDVRVRGDVGSERIAALRDGRVAVLIPPRAGGAGRLSIVSASGTTGSDLELRPDSGPGARLVRSGLWLDDVWEVSEGVLGAWVVGARAFVGVHIDLNGVVDIAHLQEGVDETSFNGPHALQLAASASLRETSDYGFEWRVSELPGALLAAGSGAAPRRPLRGCSAVGCVHDDWVRIGFSVEGEAPEPVRPEPPPRVAYPSPGFAFWTLSCAPRAGLASARSAASRAAPSRAEGAAPNRARARSSDAPESSAWLPFQAVAAPNRKSGEVGYDFGETNENGSYRAYAWGPPGDDWARRSTWQIRIGDRFSLAPPWSTRVTRSPWPDASAAARAFGLDPSTGVDWWLRLGSSGDSGVLQIRVRSESTLHLIDRDRSITTLRSAADFGTVAGAYEVRDRWYVGATRAEQFQLYRVEQGRLELVATYPLFGRVVTQLVRSVHGDELALWQKSSGLGWHVLPIDLQTFEPAPAIFIPVERLGSVPPLCEPGRPGWLAVAGVPLTDSGVSESNTHVEFSAGAEGLRTKRLTARVVIDETGICVDALSALSERALPADLHIQNEDVRRAALPLTVVDPTSEARAQFRCSP